MAVNDYVTYRLHYGTDVLHYKSSITGIGFDMATTFNETEELARYSRRSLWTMLVLVLLIGAWAAVSIGLPGTEAAAFASRFSIPLPAIIIVAAIALKPAKGVRVDPSAPAMKAFLKDELRQASLNLACRNGFLSVLLVQPLLALAPTWIAVARPASMMACLTLTTGALVAIASMLYYDR
jgi:hypothetical protein